MSYFTICRTGMTSFLSVPKSAGSIFIPNDVFGNWNFVVSWDLRAINILIRHLGRFVYIWLYSCWVAILMFFSLDSLHTLWKERMRTSSCFSTNRKSRMVFDSDQEMKSNMKWSKTPKPTKARLPMSRESGLEIGFLGIFYLSRAF